MFQMQTTLAGVVGDGWLAKGACAEALNATLLTLSSALYYHGGTVHCEQ